MDSTYSTSTDSGAFLGIVFAIAIVGYLIGGFIMGKVFQKAGRPLWAGFIPFYNYWVYAEVAGKPGWYGLLAILASVIPFVGGIISLVLLIILALELGKKFGKSTVFSIFGLWLFSLIGLIILAFGDSQYESENTSYNSGNNPVPNGTPEIFAQNNPQPTQAQNYPGTTAQSPTPTQNNNTPPTPPNLIQ